MILKNELVARIRDYFDLNIYETKVWIALLGKGSASAGEIAKISGVPRSRAYDVLESLEKKGFVLTKLGKPVKYLGVKPKIILEKLKNNVRVDADERMQMLSKVKNTDEFNQLEELYNVGINPVKREDVTASIKGRSTISNYLREIIEESKKEVIISMNASEMKLKEKLFLETFNLLKRKNVEIKISLYGDIKIIEHLSKTFKIPVKKMPVEAKFFIIDKKQVLFYLKKESSKDDEAIWLNSDFFSSAFAELFKVASTNENDSY